MSDSKFKVLLFLILGSFSCATAQTAYVGLSMNYSGVANSNQSIDFLYNTNPSLGIGLKSDADKPLALSAEVQYSIKGFKVKGAYHPEGQWLPAGNSNSRTHYLDLIPTLGINKKNLTYLIGGQLGVKLLDTSNDRTIDELNLPQSSTFDLGGLVGIKYSLNNYWLRCTYTRGFLNAVEEAFFINENGSEERIKFFNSNIQLSLGVNVFKS